jgi:hypothetical protein
MQKPTTPVARQRKKPSSVQSLTKLGRERLSRHFFMRDFLNSEISNFYQIPNIPDDPALALTAGRALAIELLDPLVDTFGPTRMPNTGIGVPARPGIQNQSRKSGKSFVQRLKKPEARHGNVPCDDRIGPLAPVGGRMRCHAESSLRCSITAPH